MAHIQHLVEDRDITAADMIDIATAAWWGTLKDATEKLDGANLVYSCTSKLQTRAARSESDIKAGGLIGPVLEAKFTGRGLVQDTFTKGFEALRRSMLSLSMRAAGVAFEDAHLWYSAEIIYTKNPNVVQYEHDALVLHERPVLCYNGFAVSDHDSKGFTALEAGVGEMNEAAGDVGWRVHGPKRVQLERRTNQIPLDEFVQSVRRWFEGNGSVQDTLMLRAREDLAKYRMPETMLDDAAARLTKAKGCASLTVLRSRVPSQVAVMLRSSDEWVAKQVAPLELAVVDFGVALMRGVKPSMVADPDSEAKRIREKLEESLLLVKKSRNQHAVEYVAKQMAKLKDPSRVVTPVEGVVFPWKGKLYKITGAFASVNAIIGLCRYGRGKDISPISG